MENQVNLNNLIIYRGLLKNSLLARTNEFMQQVLNSHNKDTINLKDFYFDIYNGLVNWSSKSFFNNGDIWKDFVLTTILEDENPFSLKCEKDNRYNGREIMGILQHDINILLGLYNLDWSFIGQKLGIEDELVIGKSPLFKSTQRLPSNQKGYINDLKSIMEGPLQKNKIDKVLESLIKFYGIFGCGILAFNKAFKWDKGLIPIINHDPARLEDLVGYQHQKETLLNNTKAFIKGKKANNILLFGDRGTGKSTSVKAMLNHFGDQGLKMIEIAKHHLKDFAQILNMLKNRGHRFIIFIDDLSFEDFEVEYKYIKALLEGGLEAIPENVIIYATSNRRHIVRENWTDRDSSEIYKTDTVQEKLSLADRFGVTITFENPNQQQYLNIVEELAKKNNIDIPLHELRKMATRWEMSYHGPSGRSARQFITYIQGALTEK